MNAETVAYHKQVAAENAKMYTDLAAASASAVMPPQYAAENAAYWAEKAVYWAKRAAE